MQNTGAERTSHWLWELIHAHRVAAYPSQFELLRTEKSVFEQQGSCPLPPFRLNVDIGVVRNPVPSFGSPTRVTYLINRLERDHSHVKQRRSPLRGPKRSASAATLARGHALIRNLRAGFSRLTETATPNLRGAAAWPRLTQAV